MPGLSLSPGLGLAPGWGRLTGGLLALKGESSGLGIDFTTLDGLGSVAVKGHTTNLNNVPVNDFLTNAGTSTKWVRNAAGIYVEKPAETVVIEFGSDGVPYLLSEPEATNLQVRSQEFDDPAWSKSNVTISADAVTSPDGQSTADTITDDATSGSHSVNDGITLASATDAAFSVFAKAGTTSYFQIRYVSTSENFIVATFDLSDTGATEASATDVGTTSGTIASTKQEAVGNGWFRCTLVGQVGAANGFLAIDVANSATPTNNNLGQVLYSGSGDTLHLWQAQAETGTVATSPIPTAGATVTRVADRIQILASAFPVSEAGGTLYSEIYGLIGSSAGLKVTAASGWGVGSTSPRVRTTAGGATSMAAFGESATAVNQITTKWTSGVGIGASLNGGAVTSLANIGTLSGFVTMQIGYHDWYSGIFWTSGRLWKIIYVPRIVSDADLPTWRYAP